MTITRYAFGLIPGAFIAFLNVLTCLGWSMVNTMAGALVFYSLSDYKVPLAVCILILSIVYVLMFPSFTDIIQFLGFQFPRVQMDPFI